MHSLFIYTIYFLLTLSFSRLAVYPYFPNEFDLFVKLNIAVAFISLIFAMGLPKKIGLILCPIIFVVTTAYRLNIHFGTVRQILLSANVGDSIFFAGNFIVGGNLYVGSIFFLILTIIFIKYLLKFSKTASRCNQDLSDKSTKSEKRRLNALSKAALFIRFEAILGIVFSLISLLGGFWIGTTIFGMTPSDAIQTYSLLSFGDSLVFLISSLLTAISAAIIAKKTLHNERCLIKPLS